MLKDSLQHISSARTLHVTLWDMALTEIPHTLFLRRATTVRISSQLFVGDVKRPGGNAGGNV